MSRVGKKPIEIPEGVTVSKTGSVVTVTGKKGTLELTLHPIIDIEIGDGTTRVVLVRHNKMAPALWGLFRALIANMVIGVTTGFQKKLEIEGVGYRVSLDGSTLVFLLGFSHPVRVDAPEGIAFAVERNNVFISGIKKALVSETAAKIRSLRPPEPYKGKGIRYEGEIIRRKAGKKSVAGG